MAQRRRSVTGLNDLTQDCILWDESKNVDLRKVASPGFQTPAFDETPHDEGHQQQRPVNRRRSSLQEVSRCLPYQPEKEIESIFTRLEGDDTTKGTANVELPTQRRRNKNFGRPPSATVAELAALKSRKRQRKHDGISKPVPFSDGRTDSSGKGGGSVKTDGFEDLLQQVKTPSPSATTITAHETAKENAGNGRTPDEFGDFDISMDDLQMMESIAQNHLSQKQDTNKKEDPFGEFPDDFDFEELERKNAQMTQGTMVMAKPASNENQDDNEDPFGDFPDEIDFEALDRSNAEAIKKSHAVPPVDALVRNTRSTSVGAPSSDPSFLTFSRYKVVRLDQDPLTHTLSLWVAAWQDTMLGENDTKALHRYHESSKMALPSRKQWQADGVIHLRGEWYHTKVEEGDVIHVCSLFGKFRTDTLPLVLHTRPPPGSDPDDLVLVVHPDLLLTPTGISEAVSCPRRAILRGRLGSTGLSSEAPLFGTMRHELFEAMMKNKDFSVEFASKMIPTIARKNAEGLLSCGVTNRQAEVEVAKVVPQIQSFARLYTNLVGNHDRHIADVPLLEPGGSSPPVRFVVEELEAIEEPIISPELGLKGNLDAIVRAKTATSGVDVQTALMPVELKTGHRQQTQHAHLAQLALYTLMLGVRYGSSTQNSAAGDSNEAKRDGLLLYINNDSIRAVHVMPLLPEIKSLMGQRNVVAFESLKSSRPRGVVLSYENQGESLQNAPK